MRLCAYRLCGLLVLAAGLAGCVTQETLPQPLCSGA